MLEYDYLRTKVIYKKSQLFFKAFKEKEKFLLQEELTQLHQIFNLWYDKRETKDYWSRFFLGGNKSAYWGIIYSRTLHFKGENRLLRDLEEANLKGFSGLLVIDEKYHQNFKYYPIKGNNLIKANFYGQQIVKLLFPPLFHPFKLENSYGSYIIRNRIECRKSEALAIVNSYLGLEAILLKDACWKEGIFVIEKDPIKLYFLKENIKLNKAEDRIKPFQGSYQSFLETNPFKTVDLWVNPGEIKVEEKVKNQIKGRIIIPGQ